MGYRGGRSSRQSAALPEGRQASAFPSARRITRPDGPWYPGARGDEHWRGKDTVREKGMRLLERWRAWRRARTLGRLRQRHGEAPPGLGRGQWIAERAPRPEAGNRAEAGNEAEETAAKLKKLGAAIKAARRQRGPRGRARRNSVRLPKFALWR